MPRAAIKRRAQTHLNAEQDVESSNFDGFDASSPNEYDGSKRMRLRGGRDAPSEMEMGDEDEDDETAEENFTPPPTNGRFRTNGTANGLEFHPGAIVRVTVENFVTYEKAEFLPGPSMNMVIGPNGTGKSSLVCAICLGLGYPPYIMGRATTFSEFVKHGKEHGTVEIELQKLPQDKKNYVVKLKINRGNDHRDFWINGRPAPHKAVTKLCKELRIQIDNLCQFLPQDRVVEFGAMHPVEMLDRTLQAVAPKEMLQQRLQLKHMYDEQKTMQKSLETDAETLRSLKTRQEGLQADVERLREREEIQGQIQNLKDARLVLNYNEKKAAYKETRDQKKRAIEKLKRLEDASGPALEDVTSKEHYAAQVENILRARERRSRNADVEVGKAFGAVENAKIETNDVGMKRRAEQDLLKNKKAQVAEYRAKITSLEGQLKNGKAIETKFNATEWNHKIRAYERQHTNFVEQRQELEGQREAVKSRGIAKRQQMEDLQKELESLDSQEGQKLSRLRLLDKHATEAYEWLRDNQKLFEKEVFGPPMLTCSVKDKRYSNQIQSLLQKDDFTCFTAQTVSDHRKLTEELYKKRRLHVAIRTSLGRLDSFHPPIPRQELQHLGLDGYALDFLEGPEPVLAMLCSEKKLHLNGVALKEVTEQQFQKISDGEKINSWATETTSYRITRRREYGPSATSTISKNLQPGKWWTDEPVDASAKRSLEQRLKECRREFDELREQMTEVKSKLEKIDEEAQEVQQQLEAAKDQKNRLQSEFNRWHALPDKIKIQENNLERTKSELEGIKKSISTFDDEFDRLALERAELVLQHQQRLAALREANQAVLEAQTRHIEAVSDVAALKLRNADIVQRLEEERQKVTDLTGQLEQLKSEAQNAGAILSELWTLESGDTDEGRRDLLIELAQDKTVESITEDIQTEEARLDLIHATDPGVLRDFEKRAQDIGRLEAAHAAAHENLQGLGERVQDLRGQWEPELDEIFRKINDGFSYNFEQIDCGGEVAIHKDEDFEKWAVHIKVKFRESETLQLLDNHRQSGGERAVSTAFYLLALQSMAQGPFRVVDEINQGMDQRNERKVYERMIDIACNEYTSQYFLITPKLLQNLQYDERMKILCVASGEHMPDQGVKMDFSHCLKLKRGLLAAASA